MILLKIFGKRISRLNLIFKIISIISPRFHKLHRIKLINKKVDYKLKASLNKEIAKIYKIMILIKQIFKILNFQSKMIIN